MQVIFKNQILNKNEAVINPGIEAFRYGQGFFSTTRIQSTIPLWIDEHITRLKNSLQNFGMAIFDEKEVRKASRLWPRINNIVNGYLRIMVWEENGESKFYINGGGLNNEQISPVKLDIAGFCRHSSDPLAGHKSFNYWHNIIAYQEAVKRGYYDSLLLNEKGEVCETSRCNIFWSIDNTIYTPHPVCGLLPGIGRLITLKIAEELGMNVKEGHFTLEEVEKAEEVFLTNSVRGIIPVSQLGIKQYQIKTPLITHLKQQLNKRIDNYIRIMTSR